MKNKITDFGHDDKFDISDAFTVMNKIYREENVKAVGAVILVEKDGQLLVKTIDAYSNDNNNYDKSFALLGSIEYLKDQVKDDE
ncbi:hypothetical protein [Lentilactobacillus kosonis]|uniref:Uncharacterized protein n=1 Tax=Lentilactobacillus kosonis TaxID=2810561 RepID=A0A401FPL5_9LACO|nr:hypothetical protein [Lentilactobacillus kosonis]GAY74256.1 hypothetical protein NBRC111893_2402 [Lentilactobacillus kosonis]